MATIQEEPRRFYLSPASAHRPSVEPVARRPPPTDVVLHRRDWKPFYNELATITQGTAFITRGVAGYVWRKLFPDEFEMEWTAGDRRRERAAEAVDAEEVQCPDDRMLHRYLKKRKTLKRRPVSRQVRYLAELLNCNFGPVHLRRDPTEADRLAMHQYAVRMLKSEEHEEEFTDVRHNARSHVATLAVTLASTVSPELAEHLVETAGPIGRLDRLATQVLAARSGC